MSNKKKKAAFATFLSTATGTRTPVFAVRGRRLDRLTMAAYKWLPNLDSNQD